MSPIVGTICSPAAGRLRASSGGGGTALFADDFSSGNFSKTENGVSWGGQVNVAVVTNFGRQSGCSARFNFASGWSELRFVFANGPYPEIYQRYYIYYPNGAESPSVGPRVASTTNNSKFSRIYSLPENQYPRRGASTYGTTPSGDKTLGPQAGIFPGTGTVSQIPSLIAPWLVDANRGRWIKIEFYDKGSTSAGAPNGIQTIWIDDVQVNNVTTINDYEAPGRGFDGGYLQGADNAMTNAGTFVYITDVAFSTTGRV
jgi:hypothetical protein